MWSENVSEKGKAIPVQVWTGPSGPRSLRVLEFPDNQHMRVPRLSALCNGHLHPQETSLVLITIRCSVDPKGHSAAGRIKSIKNTNDPIRNLIGPSSLQNSASTNCTTAYPIVSETYHKKAMARKSYQKRPNNLAIRKTH
jgi:hypothetical protein